MKIKRGVCVGTSLLPTGFNELIETKSRADLVVGLRNLTGLEIAEPVRTSFSYIITPSEDILLFSENIYLPLTPLMSPGQCYEQLFQLDNLQQSNNHLIFSQLLYHLCELGRFTSLHSSAEQN